MELRQNGTYVFLVDGIRHEAGSCDFATILTMTEQLHLRVSGEFIADLLAETAARNSRLV
jgi:hypothetical protein